MIVEMPLDSSQIMAYNPLALIALIEVLLSELIVLVHLGFHDPHTGFQFEIKLELDCQ